MSADNWRKCPKCAKTKQEQHSIAIEKAKSMYGKVPEEEYRDAIESAKKPLYLEDTFREDYEQGMGDDGSYSVSYCGCCQSCDFKFTYSHTEKALGEK